MYLWLHGIIMSYGLIYMYYIKLEIEGGRGFIRFGRRSALRFKCAEWKRNADLKR